ncbi:MAG: hypothetical protein R2726_00665 [Acidimicrobiales bacterium]
MSDPALERLRLLASAIAARPVDVAATAPGEPAWTDGTTIHVDATATPAAQLQALAVQASLLAAGSLDPAVVGELGRRHAARRYLAVEGHRPWTSAAYLPRAVREIIDRRRNERRRPRRIARPGARAATLPEPPPTFGTIRPRPCWPPPSAAGRRRPPPGHRRPTRVPTRCPSCRTRRTTTRATWVSC